MIVVLVKYYCKPGRREAFLNTIKGKAIDECCRSESGNIQYAYSLDAEDRDVLILTELWKDADALASHFKEPYMKTLGEIKDDFCVKTEVRKFSAEEL